MAKNCKLFNINEQGDQILIQKDYDYESSSLVIKITGYHDDFVSILILGYDDEKMRNKDFDEIDRSQAEKFFNNFIKMEKDASF